MLAITDDLTGTWRMSRDSIAVRGPYFKWTQRGRVGASRRNVVEFGRGGTNVGTEWRKSASGNREAAAHGPSAEKSHSSVWYQGGCARRSEGKEISESVILASVSSSAIAGICFVLNNSAVVISIDE